MWLALCLAASAVDFDEHERFVLYPVHQVQDAALERAAGASVRFATGSGFVAEPSGLVLTNHHIAEVVGDTPKVIVGWRDPEQQGQVVELELVRDLPELDVAIYRAARDALPPGIPLRDSPPRPGEAVALVGHPFDLPQRIGFGQVLVGQASINGMGITEYQTGAMMGSSGSALVDREGRALAMHQGWDMTHAFHGGLIGIRMDVILDRAPELLEDHQ